MPCGICGIPAVVIVINFTMLAKKKLFLSSINPSKLNSEEVINAYQDSFEFSLDVLIANQ